MTLKKHSPRVGSGSQACVSSKELMGPWRRPWWRHLWHICYPHCSVTFWYGHPSPFAWVLFSFVTDPSSVCSHHSVCSLCPVSLFLKCTTLVSVGLKVSLDPECLHSSLQSVDPTLLLPGSFQQLLQQQGLVELRCSNKHSRDRSAQITYCLHCVLGGPLGMGLLEASL